MLAAFATDPGPPSELIRLSEHRSHVSRHRAILARPEPEFLRNALVAIRAVAAMIPEELRHALRHCCGAHGWSSMRLSATSSILPNNHPLSHVAKYRSRRTVWADLRRRSDENLRPSVRGKAHEHVPLSFLEKK